jgi:hypothetical protein
MSSALEALPSPGIDHRWQRQGTKHFGFMELVAFAHTSAISSWGWFYPLTKKCNGANVSANLLVLIRVMQGMYIAYIYINDQYD